MKIWAITWKYADKSEFGIVGLYGKEDVAKERLDLLIEHGDITKVFEIHTLEVRPGTFPCPAWLPGGVIVKEKEA